MVRNLILLMLTFVVAATLYKFRARIILALRRFDSRNALRRYEELRDRHDRFAHYRHTVRMAEDEVEEITSVTISDERTGTPVTRYLFLGEYYATHQEADMARRAAVMAKARDFYLDLDNLYLARRSRPKVGNAELARPADISETKH